MGWRIEGDEWTSEEVRDADGDAQFDLLKAWFLERYEDPAERTPYESSEGGYIWIWGGPFDAGEVLHDEFSGIVPREVIDQVVSKLEENVAEWAPVETESDYDDYYIESLRSISEFLSLFAGRVLDIESLNKLEVPSHVEPLFRRLVYLSVITAMEAYLSEVFISSVMSEPELKRRLVESTPEFQSEKIPVSQVFSAFSAMDARIKKYLTDVVWHNLPRVKKMYEAVLLVKFPDISKIMTAVAKRHDIVHRHGMNKDGIEIPLSAADVDELVRDVETFVQSIDPQIRAPFAFGLKDTPF